MVKHSLRSNAGSALVELALVAPLLCLVLIGSVELGRIAYAAIEVSNAARAAVAYGSQNRTTAASAPGTPNTLMEQAAAADASDLASMGATLTWPASASGLPNPSQYCVCDDGSSAPPTVTCDIALQQCPSTKGTIVVYVQASPAATISTMFHYPGIPTTFTLHGFAQMRVVED